MRQLAVLLHTTRINTTPANPRSNGLAENHMRGLKDTLAMHANANRTDWDTWLPTMAFMLYYPFILLFRIHIPALFGFNVSRNIVYFVSEEG